MKDYLRYLLLVLLVLGSLRAAAQDEPVDTVYFYKTWHEFLHQEPVSMLINPYIFDQSQFQLFFEINDEEMNYVIEHEFMAACLWDSIWLINSEYLKKSFDGDVRHLVGYIPLIFNDKLAYFRYGGYPYKNQYWKLDPTLRYGGEYEDFVWHYYYIDFKSHRLLKVDHSVLSELLEDYHDLQVRYEGMKDYKKRSIIEYFFLLFVDRASQDIMRPYILDLVEK